MKVLLLYPNLYGMNMLPPAIGLFTTILKAEGHEVRLFDSTLYEGLFGSVNSDKMKSENLNARPYDDSILKDSLRQSDAESDFLELVNTFKPDIIAVSCTEDMYPVGIQLLEALKSRDAVVVAGGVFPTFAPELTLKLSRGTIDFVLMGEGEETLPDFCKRIEEGKDVYDLDGLVWLDEFGGVHRNQLPRAVPIEKKVIPDFTLFDDSRFFRPMQGKMWRMLPVETIRGCPFTCTYCNSPSQMDMFKAAGDQFFRRREMGYVRDQLRIMVDEYGADSFYFWADTFLSWGPKQFEEFCEMYEEFKLPFWIQTRPETITEDKVQRLKSIGLLRIAFGLEHGNEEFRRKILKRTVTNSEIIEKLDIVAGLRVPFSVNNILGFPTETRDLVFDTIELNRKIKSDGINAYTFVPFHGTPLRKMAEDLGYVEPEAMTRSIVEPTVLKMPDFSPEQIEGIRRTFVLYVKMPKDRWAEIKKAEALTPEGDEIFQILKKETADKYMHYGYYDATEDIDAIGNN